MLFPTTGRTDIKPVATETLRCLGLIELGRTIKGGLCEVVVAPPGIRVLAGLPGDEFNGFRDAVAAQETPDA